MNVSYRKRYPTSFCRFQMSALQVCGEIEILIQSIKRSLTRAPENVSTTILENLTEARNSLKKADELAEFIDIDTIFDSDVSQTFD